MEQTTIGMLLFQDFQLLDVAGPLDMFAATPGLRPIMVGKTRDPVSPAALPAITFTPDADYFSAPPLDILFVPGGSGIAAAIRDPQTLAFLIRRAPDARFITSVCTGALVLGAAGLLAGYRAATHWRYMDLLALVGAEPVDERVVRDRNRITSGGVIAGIDFGLVLVSEIMGEAIAQATQLSLQYAPDPPYHAGHPSTAPASIVDEVRNSTQAMHGARAELLRSLAPVN